jgi:hypothetical protein
MIRLHPNPDGEYACPYCQLRMQVKGWYIPGMRNLADLQCPQCRGEFYGDLSAGHGLYYPMLLDRSTGAVHDEYGVGWFANWLRESYANRCTLQIGFVVEEFRPLRRVVLLNCLDVLYGHCLLKLLNAQYYLDRYPDLDLVVLIPKILRWLVPDGVAAVWTVDLPLAQGIEWNEWLAARVKSLIGQVETCRLSVAVPHPAPEDYRIERFTRVNPFPIDQWVRRLDRPTVTFIWREDRVWHDAHPTGHRLRVMQWLRRGHQGEGHRLKEQTQKVVVLGETLRRAFPKINFAVAGLGHPGNLPSWIGDLRTLAMNEDVERAWCDRYAQSHVVLGVHGSNMLLPSAHAGAVIELVPDNRWGNLIQDMLLPVRDSRELLYRYRFLPLESSVAVIAEATISLLQDLPHALSNFRCDHETMRSDPLKTIRERREARKESSRVWKSGVGT